MMRQALFLLACFVVASSDTSPPAPHERQLVKFLFDDYNPLVRPSKEPNSSVVVTIGMSVESITDVNDKEGTITISGWVDMMWKDYYLCWDPSTFGNITRIVIPSEKIWRPDVAFNTIVGDRFFSATDVPSEIRNDCMVTFSPGGRGTHSCNLDMTTFPFDTQICQFVILTWFSSVQKVQLIHGNISFDKNEENEAWSIVSAEADIGTAEEGNGNKVVFTLKIRRKPLYYALYVIVPLLMLAVLNLMIFRLPPESGEKLSFSITILLAFSIWLIMLNDLTPSSSDSIPILAILTTTFMLLAALSTVATVYVIRAHHVQPRQPIPPWARKVTGLFSFGKCRRKTKIEDKMQVNAPVPLTWYEVSAAIDSLFFAIATLLTLLLILLSIICFLAL